MTSGCLPPSRVETKYLSLKVAGATPTISKFEDRPHLAQIPVGSVESGDVSGSGRVSSSSFGNPTRPM
jgi:hypothetical protein